jgi:DNA-binding NarL/FixJ family response regulator
MDEAAIPILLVEDNPADVAIIQRSLKKGNLHNPVRVARDGAEAIDCLHDHVMQPGVLILDINLPKLDGMEVLRAAKRLDPETVAVMLTSHASLQTAVQSLRREGAFDYIEKSKDDLPQLVEAVRLALKKRALQLQTRWVVRSQAGGERVIDMTQVKERFDLSDREIDVVKCLCRGDTNKEIGERLFISDLTVKGHLKHIFQKMDVHNRATLVATILAAAGSPYSNGERPPAREPSSPRRVRT